MQWPLTLTYIFKIIQPWFAVKLLKYVTSCRVHSTACTVLDGFFLYLAQVITSMSRCFVCNDIWPWPISSRSYNHDFPIKLLKYGTPWHVRSTALIVLDEFFPYLAQMITSMRRCVTCNDLWPWSISSRVFSYDIAYFMDYIHMWHKHNPWGDDVSCTIARSKVNCIFAFCRGGYHIIIDHRSTIF